jgi:hypothetical protein
VNSVEDTRDMAKTSPKSFPGKREENSKALAPEVATTKAEKAELRSKKETVGGNGLRVGRQDGDGRGPKKR